MYQILSFRSEGKFSARWYSFCTELHNVKIHEEISRNRVHQGYSPEGFLHGHF